MAFKTTCPKCNEESTLYVSCGKFLVQGMRLYEDGFAFADAKQVETEDEWVECHACGAGFQLSEVTE